MTGPSSVLDTPYSIYSAERTMHVITGSGSLILAELAKTTQSGDYMDNAESAIRSSRNPTIKKPAIQL